MESLAENTPNRPVLLSLQGINLAYGSITALHDVSFSVGAGEVRAIVGEHGAGKSSLAKVISGIVAPNSGSICMRGIRFNSLSRARSLRLGIDAVFQQPQLNANFSVAENLFVPIAGARNALIYHAHHYESLARAYLQKLGFDIDPKATADQLNLSDQTIVAVLRTLHHPPRLLILDEALEKIDSGDLVKIVGMIRSMKKKGMAVILITHSIDSVYSFAEKVTIVRKGRVLLTESVRDIDKINLIKIAYTEMTEAEGRAGHSKDFYQLLRYNEAILKKLPSTLLVVDVAKNIKMLNDHARAWFNLHGGPHHDVSLDDLFQGKEPTVVDLLNKAIMKNKQTRYYNLRFTLGKTPTIADITVYPIHDGALVLGHIIIIEDVTERERLREQIMLSEKLASVGLLAAGVAHEINNPLGTIANYLEALKYIACPDPALQELRVNLEEQYDSIAHIVGTLINFSDGTRTADEEVDVGEVLRTIGRLLRLDAERRKINIVLRLCEQPAVVRINHNEFKQVVLNLFKNSLEAMPEGGTISISVSRINRASGPAVHIKFGDTGCGIGSKDPTDVFLPFYSTKKGGGTNLGLGLSISYNIVAKYGGSISVRNRKSRGCEFEITFPAAER